MATRKKKNNIGAFGHPIFGKGFAKYGEMRSNGSSEIPNDLEEAAKDYSCSYKPIFPPSEKRGRLLGFIDGAKWQEEQDQETIELAEDHAFLAGADWQREQMMKEAVEGYVTLTLTGVRTVAAAIKEEDNIGVGNKVRIIIVKE